MRNLFVNYSIQKINDELQEMIKGDGVNNLKLFVASNESKLSVTLRPDPKKYPGYHGLHPKFDEKELKAFLSNHDVNSSRNFWRAVMEEQRQHHYMTFISGEDDSIEGSKEDPPPIELGNIRELEEILLGRAVLQMASHFGFRLECKEKKLREELEKDLHEIWSEYTRRSLFITEEELEAEGLYWNIIEAEVRFFGIWPIEVIEIIVKKYTVDINLLGNLKISRVDTNLNQTKGQLKELLTFHNKDFIGKFDLLGDGVYYSGVMPRVMRLEYIEDPCASNQVKYLILHVARTTFATVDFMDNPRIVNHPFFREEKSMQYYEKMVQFDYFEDMAQDMFLYAESNSSLNMTQTEYEKCEIEKINNYLKYSFNTHTVAVSANIKTKDGYLILAKRSGASIDAGEYYCSANGQSEFRDENVEFYRNSVFEDLPSMDYHSVYRVDLNQEIQREAIAELSISHFVKEWKYYGISYLSINSFVKDKVIQISKTNSSKVQKRRMHFNVLTSNTTPILFEEVVKNREFATEKFENSKIIGLQAKVFKSKSAQMRSQLAHLYNEVNRQKSRILLVLLFITVIINKNQTALINMSNMIEISLLVIYLIMVSYGWFKSKTLRRLKRHKRFLAPNYIRGNLFDMQLLLNELSSKIKTTKEKERFHAIFRIMFILFFLEEQS